MPKYYPDLTPVDKVNGFLTEVFRKQAGVRRSGHPHVSFAAWGANANRIVRGHSLENPLGEQSPLARLYDLDAKILLLGAAGDALTALHLSEYFVPQLLDKKRTWAAKLTDREGAPWIKYSDVDNNSDYFPGLLADYEAQSGTCSVGMIGRAESKLIPMPDIVDFGIMWLCEHREIGHMFGESDRS
jgi:aminoglycoside 3-N-acetyltransferase